MNYNNQYNFYSENAQPGSPLWEGSAEAVFAERKRISRAGHSIGGGLLIFLALPFLISLALQWIVPLIGIDAAAFFAELNSYPTIWIYQAILSLIVFTIPYIFAALFYGQKTLSAVMFSAPKKGTTLNSLLLGLGVCAAANLMAGMFEQVVGYGGNTIEDTFGSLPQDPAGILIVVLVVCALPALLEEFAFRGVVLGIARNVSEPFAIFVSALLFGLMHGNLSQIPSAFLFGLALGYAAIRAKSIWPACLIHFVCNGISIAMTYASAALTEESASVFNICFYIIMFALGGLGIIQSVKKDKDAFSLKSSETNLSAAKKFGLFITRPSMILFVITVVIEMIILELKI